MAAEREPSTGGIRADSRNTPVAPGRLPVVGHMLSLLRQPLRFLAELTEHGDVVLVHCGSLPVYLVTDPALAWRVLVTDADRFDRGIVLDPLRPLFGDSLATSTGEHYRRQRRLVRPGFHRDRIAGHTPVMAGAAAELTESWVSGELVEVDRCMRELALTIVERTLFPAELGNQVFERVRRSLPILLGHGMIRAFAPKLVALLPTRGNRRFDEAARQLHEAVGEAVAKARADGVDHGDLLSMLLLARDGETGRGMTDRQLHDEVVTILIAGSDPTAGALSWLFHEIGRRPDIRRRLYSEVDEVLAGRTVAFDDLPKLVYTRRVVNEVLRMYPPLILTRRTRRPVDLGAVHLRPGAEVAVSPYTLHRDRRWFAEPDRFDPDRWCAERAEALPNGAFVPFGAGARRCPGDLFGLTEIAVIAATVASRWHLMPVPGAAVHLRITTSIRPNRLPMTALRRG